MFHRSLAILVLNMLILMGRGSFTLISTCALSSLQALAAESAPGAQKIELTVAVGNSTKGHDFRAQGVFSVSFEGVPNNNLQSIGRTKTALILATVEPNARSTDVYFVTVSFLDREKEKIVQSAAIQIGFASPKAKRSEPVGLNVNTVLFYKTQPTSQVAKEKDNVRLVVSLTRL